MSANGFSKRRGLHHVRVAVAFKALLVATVFGTGCDSDDELQRALSGDAATSGTILSAMSQARTASGVVGVLLPGSPMVGSNAGLAVTLTPSAVAVTNGGTASLAVSAATAFSELTLAVTGLAGFYQFTLPAPVTSTTLQLTIDQDIMTPTVTFSVVASDGVDFGPAATQDFTIVFVGTGDVQVSLTFDQQDDVDLSVTDPNGDTVFFGNRSVASGGMLDLDANPVCGSPRGNAENITWPEGTAPDGNYDVFVDLFANCFPSPVNYTVTITVVGSDPQLLTGTLVPADALLGPMLITSFVVASPPPAP